MSTETTETITSEAFCERLRAARQAANLTQAQLGEGLGKEGADLGKGAVSSWEVGMSTPSPHQLALICRRLGVSADRLLDTVPPDTGSEAAKGGQ